MKHLAWKTARDAAALAPISHSFFIFVLAIAVGLATFLPTESALARCFELPRLFGLRSQESDSGTRRLALTHHSQLTDHLGNDPQRSRCVFAFRWRIQHDPTFTFGEVELRGGLRNPDPKLKMVQLQPQDIVDLSAFLRALNEDLPLEL